MVPTESGDLEGRGVIARARDGGVPVAVPGLGDALRSEEGLVPEVRGVFGPWELVDRFVSPMAIHHPLPEALGGAVAEPVVAGASVFEHDDSGE